MRTDPRFFAVTAKNGSVLSFDEYASSVVVPRILGDDITTDSHIGAYALHLSRWVRRFDRQQLLLLRYEELRENPKRSLDRIRQFLGHDLNDKNKVRTENAHDGNHKIALPTCAAKKILDPYFDKWNRDFQEFLENYPGPPME